MDQLRNTLRAIGSLDPLSFDLAIGGVVIYAVLVILVTITAAKRGRIALVWFLLAFVASPLIAAILLLLLPSRNDDYSVDDNALRNAIRRQNLK